ncbi:MAG: ATP-binding cassette domain-containing protein [Tissierellia bacterium]|nr:ATP-binding cassette domain-containing protein [Tissierellia bacterium]
MTELLKLSHVTKTFPAGRRNLLGQKTGSFTAVKDVSFTVAPGETLGIVGESGSGKSTLLRCILGSFKDTQGSITYEGREILGASAAELREIRRNIQLIFQDPYSSLNPSMTAGEIIAEPLINHGEKNIRERVLEAMKVCGLTEQHYRRYPHEFSGGQRQRIGIARALVLRPKIILADEPTSALDVSIQAQIINLLEELQQELGLSYVFISHNLAVVEHISHRVGVLLNGELVELGEREEIYRNPQHPYTKKLLRAVPIQHPRDRR